MQIKILNQICNQTSTSPLFSKTTGSGQFIQVLVDQGYLYFLSWKKDRVRIRFMVLNATFNNILAISWRSVLFVDETRVPGENGKGIM